MLPATDVFVDGVRSAVYQAGDARMTEAVVFLHGNPGPMDDWEDMAPACAEVGRVVAVDMPGFGRAEHPRRFDFSIQGYARHLAGVLDQLQLQRVHLVAHDFGAAWGAQWAVDHPGALASITLINPLPLCADFEWHFFAKLWQTPVVAELLQLCTSAVSIGYVMNRDNPRRLPSAFIERVASHYDWQQAVGVNKLYRATRDVARTLGPLGESLRALDPPACIIWGTADRYAPVRYAEKMRQLFTQAELHLIDHSGHWPFVDEPQAVRQLVCSFVSRQLRPSGHER
ncbi:MAG: putative 2-hydroxy-6-oxononadienedioate/2-hydroxy-6-oxononatrienedioate hydrolase [Myxococcaceae bacterium]|nr:putative 2-hydroxy-6-oxononadienedioate/2-hydroxy-6-oxononatrienedioate hydrolase [Myxococcaceae bacterium]